MCHIENIVCTSLAMIQDVESVTEQTIIEMFAQIGKFYLLRTFWISQNLQPFWIESLQIWRYQGIESVCLIPI